MDLKKVKCYAMRHPYLAQILLSLLGGVGVSFMTSLSNFKYIGLRVFLELLPMSIVLGIFLVFPFVATCFELISLIEVCRRKKEIRDGELRILYDCFILGAAMLCGWILLAVSDVVFADWYVQLYNGQKHSPVFTESIYLLYGILTLFFIALFIMGLMPVKKRPPLITVLCISFLYLGVALGIIMEIQIIGLSIPTVFMLALIPCNMILVAARLIVRDVLEYCPEESRSSKIKEVPFLNTCNSFLQNSKNWPILAVLFILPILGIVMCVLLLLGQSPDLLIKAFTETAEYTFSTKIPPQNIYYDEHYLCTVAAGGHAKVVKPLRMGKRHGHPVVVNRQLCVANAFEQILEEKTPRLHRLVRGIYDRYGFPIARLIHKKWIADLIWIGMKPLEWIFLIVIYSCDVHPEDRIAKQYL